MITVNTMQAAENAAEAKQWIDNWRNKQSPQVMQACGASFSTASRQQQWQLEQSNLALAQLHSSCSWGCWVSLFQNGPELTAPDPLFQVLSSWLRNLCPLSWVCKHTGEW